MSKRTAQLVMSASPAYPSAPAVFKWSLVCSDGASVSDGKQYASRDAAALEATRIVQAIQATPIDTLEGKEAHNEPNT